MSDLNDDLPYINQLCPRCNRAMISLRGYLAEGGPDDSGYSGDLSYGMTGDWTSDNSGFGLFNWLFAGISQLINRWRLGPVLRQFPHSLFCPGCHYVQRRP